MAEIDDGDGELVVIEPKLERPSGGRKAPLLVDRLV